MREKLIVAVSGTLDECIGLGRRLGLKNTTTSRGADGETYTRRAEVPIRRARRMGLPVPKQGQALLDSRMYLNAQAYVLRRAWTQEEN